MCHFIFQEINLSNFYAIFKLLLRDSRTLEVQASTSKRCLFRTEDMIGNLHPPDETGLSVYLEPVKLTVLIGLIILKVVDKESSDCINVYRLVPACSADGIMTVVATPTFTWPSVQPERTSLLDRTCRPKQRDRTRVLFEFKLDSCGTRAMVRLIIAG